MVNKLKKFRQFQPPNCNLDYINNWELHDETNYPFFNEIITDFDNLSRNNINLCFISADSLISNFSGDIRKWKKSVNESIFTKLKNVVNDGLVKLLLDSRTEQVMLGDRIFLFDFFKNNGFDTKQIYTYDGNINFKIIKNKTKLNIQNHLSIDWARYRYNHVFSVMFDDVIPYSDEYCDFLKNYQKPFKFLTFNGTLHPYRVGLISYLYYKKLVKYGLISCGSCNSAINKGDSIYHPTGFEEYDIIKDRQMHDFIIEFFNEMDIKISIDFVTKFLSELPFLLDKGHVHSKHEHYGESDLSHITHKDSLLSDEILSVWNKYNLDNEDILKTINNIDEKRICQQWFAGKDAEYRHKKVIEYFGKEPYGTSIVENTPGYINYKNSYFSIVSESPPINFFDMGWYGNREIRTTIHKSTEKTFQNLLFNPCVFIAAPYHIEYLHKFGYQTFPELIDESYDRIENNEKRIKFVTKQLELIINKSFSELHSIYVDILPKIKHNQLKIMQTNREEILLKSFDGIVNKNE
jgi:hypothetical protein